MSAIALVGARVWDGVAEQASARPLVLRVEHGRIAGIGEAPELLADAQRIDCAGAFVLPGLIDAHVHLTLDPELRDPDAQQRVPAQQREAAMVARAAAMVRAGITTARDLGGPDHGELALRDRIAAGEIIGPRLLCAGQPVTSVRGHCWFWGGEARDEPEIREVVRRQIARGADWIKVMATGGVITPESDTRSAQFDTEQLRALVAEAALFGRPVAAHCHGTAGIANAARARVRTIEHCSFAGEEGFGSDADPEVILEMARAGLWVSPTVNSGWRRFFREDGSPGRFLSRMHDAFARLRAARVGMIASTDAGIPGVAHHGLPEALGVFARVAGLSPQETLRSATSESARALGLAHETGVLARGLVADVLVVDGDPLADLGALLRPRLVLAGGRLVREASDA